MMPLRSLLALRETIFSHAKTLRSQSKGNDEFAGVAFAFFAGFA